MRGREVGREGEEGEREGGTGRRGGWKGGQGCYAQTLKLKMRNCAERALRNQ